MKLPKLNIKQKNRVSEIYMGIGHIALASVVIPALVDKFEQNLLLLGLGIAIIAWITSLFILKE